MLNKTVVLDGDCQLIIPQDGELGIVTAIRKPYPPYTGDTIVTPSDSIQVLNTELTTLTDNIIVNPVPGDYVGSDIPRRDDDDLTASGATVTAPAGYYEASASKTVPSGTEGTPAATKGAVSNHSVSVTPSVTNAAGYISGGIKTGEPVTVTASELESGTKSITANGEGIDVTGYAAVDVDVPSSEPTLQTITKTYTPTTSQQMETVTASAGYDGIEEVDITVNAMPTGTAGTPTATKGTVSNHSISVTPTVTNGAGYIPGGTKTGSAVTVSASELDSGTKAITANGNGQDVVGYAAVDVNVPNSYSASDEGKVVSNGALVAQIARSISANGTYDTTTNNSVSVSVPSQSPVINPLTVTENGTYTAPSGVDGYSPVTVNVSGGGGINIDDFAENGIHGDVYLASASMIRGSAFYQQTISGINAPEAKTIGEQAFYSCFNLSTASFPQAVNIGRVAFVYCSNLTTISFPNAETIGVSAFANCLRITEANFPKVASVSSSAFAGCSRITSANFPELTFVAQSAFYSCYQLNSINIPKAKTIGVNGLASCPFISTLSLPAVSTISGYAFASCIRLVELHLESVQAVPSLASYTAFNATPIGGYSDVAGQYGSIYVPASLYDSFQTAKNWSVFSSRMVSV